MGSGWWKSGSIWRLRFLSYREMVARTTTNKLVQGEFRSSFFFRRWRRHCRRRRRQFDSRNRDNWLTFDSLQGLAADVAAWVNEPEKSTHVELAIKCRNSRIITWESWPQKTLKVCAPVSSRSLHIFVYVWRSRNSSFYFFPETFFHLEEKKEKIFLIQRRY